MKVALVRNFREEQNISMKLTADRLEAALGSRVDVVNVRPWQPEWAPGSVVGKTAGYVSRYMLYPRRVASTCADVYHVIDHAYAHVAKALPRERTVCTCHDLLLLKLTRGDFGQRAVPRAATVLFCSAVAHLRDAGIVLATSEATKSDVVEMLGIDEASVRVVYPPLDPLYRPASEGLDRPALRTALGLNGRPALLHVGNNWFYKNVEGLLRAFALVVKRAPERPVLIKAGKGLSREQRRFAASLGVSDDVIETGSLMAEKLREYYWASDALVFPSLWEGFGWPPVEAMACGLPTVCGRAGALIEVAGNAAEMVDPNSPEDIASGITRVLGDETHRRNLVRRGYANVQRFRVEDYADQVFGVYCEIAGIQRSRACAG